MDTFALYIEFLRFSSQKNLLFFIIFSFCEKVFACSHLVKFENTVKIHLTYHNSLENLNQFIDKLPKTFYSVFIVFINCFIQEIKSLLSLVLIDDELWFVDESDTSVFNHIGFHLYTQLIHK